MTSGTPRHGQEEGLTRLVRAAFHAFDDASRAFPEHVVTPSVPILFFGDLSTYLESPLRVVTAALNPSRMEFPTGDPFQRFPAAHGLERASLDAVDVDRYIQALSEYFVKRPYESWFSALEPMLNGMDSSFYPGAVNTALHTDIASPVTTDPPWSRLDPRVRAGLASRGGQLWRDLIGELRPHVVLLSVAAGYLDSLGLSPVDEAWRETYAVERANRYPVLTRRYRTGRDSTTLLVFGRAAQKPFQLISNAHKSAAGAAIKEIVHD